MDLPFSFSFAALVILVVLFLSKLIKPSRQSKNHNPTQTRIPGPWKLPLVGSLHHLATSSCPPHQTLRDLARKHGPIMHLQLGEISTVVISCAKLAQEVLKTHDLVFSERQNTLAVKIIYDNGNDVAFSPYGEYWKQMRKICTVELLSNTKVRSFASIREDEAKNLVKSIQSSSVSSPFNLTKHLFSYSNALVCRATFGSTSKEQEIMIPLFAEILHLVGRFDVSDLFPSFKFLHGLSVMKPRLQRLRRKLDVILDSIIAERREILVNSMGSPSLDGSKDEKYLLDALLRLEGGGGLEFAITPSNIKAIIADMFVGGTHTTSSAIDWVMAELMKNPRVMQKAQSEIRQALNGKPNVEETDVENLSYLKSVVKESLRLHAPAPLLAPRISRAECEIGGYVLPIKTGVVINAWALGRDPEYWENPERFEPERFENSAIDFSGTHNFEYLPFGAGRRICVGTNFGFASILFPLAQLLYHFDWGLPDGMKRDELDMTEALGFGNARKSNLFVVATPHFPSK